MIGSASVVTSRDTSCAYTNVYEKLPSVYAIYARLWFVESLPC